MPLISNTMLLISTLLKRVDHLLDFLATETSNKRTTRELQDLVDVSNMVKPAYPQLSKLCTSHMCGSLCIGSTWKTRRWVLQFQSCF